MRRTVMGLLLCFSALASSAAPSPEGRWEGLNRIPGNPQPLVVDLAQGDTGAWTGSIILSGLGIKGEPLANIVVTDVDVAFDISAALGDSKAGPAHFTARRMAVDGIAGDMRQAGNVAAFSLARIGPAQVELPARSTPVALDIENHGAASSSWAAIRVESPSRSRITRMPGQRPPSSSSANGRPSCRSTS